ncbi:hypothetical protein [Dysgonomonas massiliensis]|uniref:hypothetical protein n=1 Tax=Dysgonomonas massiliensis TaxID=2040292 RepID=UPI000C78AD12|nr:hypothetical protein [Dysgonomonas massiliensis]
MNLNKNYFLAIVVILISCMFISCGDDEGDSVSNRGFDYSTKRTNKNTFEETVEGKNNVSFWLDRDSLDYSPLYRIRKIEVQKSEFYYDFVKEDNDAKNLVKTIKVTLSVGDMEGHSFEILADKSMLIDHSNMEYKNLVQEYMEKIYKDGTAKLLIQTTMSDAEGNLVPTVKFNAGLRVNYDLHLTWIGDTGK